MSVGYFIKTTELRTLIERPQVVIQRLVLRDRHAEVAPVKVASLLQEAKLRVVVHQQREVREEDA
jgi:hypothetical protein